jgi:hypothetical protein
MILEPLLAAIADGQTLRGYCKEKRDQGAFDAELHPAASTIRLWVVKDSPAGIAERYARAREAQAESWADDILELADDGRKDTFLDDKGNERVDHDHINRSKLRVDTRKWLMAKLHPRTYGEKVDVTSGGEKVPAVGVLLGPAAIEERQQRRSA